MPKFTHISSICIILMAAGCSDQASDKTVVRPPDTIYETKVSKSSDGKTITKLEPIGGKKPGDPSYEISETKSANGRITHSINEIKK